MRLRSPRAFRDDERGTIAVLWGMALVVFIGFAAIVFDLGRGAILQTEMQSFADQVALAAAGELDGQDDSIERATSAAANLVQDSTTFGDAAGALSGPEDFTLTFHRTLPASDGTALGAATATTDPLLAAFVEVEVAPRSLTMRLASALRGLTGGGTSPIVATMSASAVAGFTREACDISPLMFCLPNKTWGSTPSAVIGTEVKLRSGGNGAAWGPGNFGFVDISNADTGGVCESEKGNIERCQIAAEITISQCYSQRGVDLQPGQRKGLRDHINVRFDRYENPLSPEAIYPAAPNVVTGQVANDGASCIKSNKTKPSNAVALPRDTCLLTESCSGGRFGNGPPSASDWNQYMDVNHGDADGDYTDGDGAALAAYSSAVPAGLGDTRYAVYLKEIAMAKAVDGPILNQSNAAGITESGLPTCTPHVSADPERRVMIAAGIDCDANAINGAKKDVPVERYFKVFLTHPVEESGPKDFDIWGEIIGVEALDGYSSAGTGGIFRDVVQLYR